MARLCWLRLLAGVLMLVAPTTQADEQEILLWPADHPANAGNEPLTTGMPEWLDRVTRSPAITPFLPEKDAAAGAAVVICPGGGYGGLAMAKEGMEVAQWMQKRGIAGFVLRYRCGGGKNQQPVPLEDAQRAIRMVRQRAAEWNIDPERVGILGFSAGGHLASTAATMFDDGKADAPDNIDRLSSRPAFAVLVYPVISMKEGVTHGGSRQNLLGRDADEALVKRLVDRGAGHRQDAADVSGSRQRRRSRAGEEQLAVLRSARRAPCAGGTPRVRGRRSRFRHASRRSARG